MLIGPKAINIFQGGDVHDQRDWDRNGNKLVNLADEEVSAIDTDGKSVSPRAERTQSLSSIDRPSYAYSSQSPYGHSPYGIADPFIVPFDRVDASGSNSDFVRAVSYKPPTSKLSDPLLPGYTRLLIIYCRLSE